MVSANQWVRADRLTGARAGYGGCHEGNSKFRALVQDDERSASTIRTTFIRRSDMAGFLDRAREQVQQGLTQGKQKLDDVQAQRAGNDLLKQLGAAYYAERRGSGTPDATQQALSALEAHIATHGDGFLRG